MRRLPLRIRVGEDDAWIIGRARDRALAVSAAPVARPVGRGGRSRAGPPFFSFFLVCRIEERLCGGLVAPWFRQARRRSRPGGARVLRRPIHAVYQWRGDKLRGPAGSLQFSRPLRRTGAAGPGTTGGGRNAAAGNIGTHRRYPDKGVAPVGRKGSVRPRTPGRIGGYSEKQDRIGRSPGRFNLCRAKRLESRRAIEGDRGTETVLQPAGRAQGAVSGAADGRQPGFADAGHRSVDSEFE